MSGTTLKLYENKEVAYEAYRNSPARFFNRYHQQCLDERELISPDWKWYEVKYHYNMLENAIIDLLRQHSSMTTGHRVLDVGAGTGHWVEFYHQVLEAESIVAVDFSKQAVQALKQKCQGVESLEVREWDITKAEALFAEGFSLISAIGVMFHIVDDDNWRSALGNLVSYLAPNGLSIVGGEFGDRTAELGVMRKVRSLREWQHTLQEFGGRVIDVRRFNWFKGDAETGLKNNLLVFRRT